MDNNISSEILNWQSESNLNWNALVDYIYNKRIVIIDSKLKSGFGMATYYGIHLNMDYFKFVNGEIRYFLIKCICTSKIAILMSMGETFKGFSSQEN